MAAQTHYQGRVDIGPYRKIRLHPIPNRQGYYEVWWTEQRNGKYGTQRESSKTKLLAEAQAFLKKFIADLTAQYAAPAPAIALVDKLCEQWIEDALAAGRVKANKWVLNPVRRELGSYTADLLAANRSQLLRDYRNARSAAGISNGSIRRELGALCTVLMWSAEEGLIPRGDVPSFKKLLPPPGPARDKFLDRDQELWFWDQAQAWGNKQHPQRLAQAAAKRVALFCAIAMATSARRGAILDLTWERVDLKTGLIDFRLPGAREHTKRRVRVRIAPRLLPILQEAWRWAPKLNGQATGRVLGIGPSIEAPFRTFTTAIGVPWVTPHTLRHTWASLAAMRGVPLSAICEIMGDRMATVEKHYLHLTPDFQMAALDHQAAPPAAP